MLATARELHDWFEAIYSGRVLNPSATETYKEITLRPSRIGNVRAIGVAGGNGISTPFTAAGTKLASHSPVFRALRNTKSKISSNRSAMSSRLC